MQRVAQRSRYSCIGLQILICVLLKLIMDIPSTEGGIVVVTKNSLEGRCMLMYYSCKYQMYL